jgi:signal transduction histidine kinase
MLSRDSGFIDGALLGIGPVYADWFVRRTLLQQRLNPASPPPSSLEQAFSNLVAEVTPGRGADLRIFVQGKRRALDAAIHRQLFLIGREAIMNALRHSEAASIEVEIQYLRSLLRVSVRDNGCGIDPELVQARDSHSGLCEMRDRADSIGAQFGIWSGLGAGTEVRVAAPVAAAIVSR